MGWHNKFTLAALFVLITTHVVASPSSTRNIPGDQIKRSGGAVLSLPNATDTLTGRASTDTLTNKTLTSPSFTAGAAPSAPGSGFTLFGDASNRPAWKTSTDAFVRALGGTLTADRVFTLPDASTTLVGTDATQTLTNKDIDGGTAANTRRITLPRDTKTNLDALDRKTGTVVFGTDTLKAYIDNGTALTPIGSGSGNPQQLLTNGDYETDAANWTASGSSVLASVSTAANVGLGSKSISWDPSAASETLTSDSVALTDTGGPTYRNGVISCLVKTAATDLKMQAYDGTNVLTPNSSTDVVPSSSAGFVRYTHNFIFPSSGTVALRFISASNSAIAYIDDCFMGAAEGFNLSHVSQAELYGTAKTPGTANCLWSTTSTSMANFAADADCPVPTVTGNASAPATKIPGLTFASLPPAIYKVNFSMRVASSGSPTCFMRITDGTTPGHAHQTAPPADTHVNVSAIFTYTTAQGSTTFQAQAYRTGGTTCEIAALNGPLQDILITVEKFPLSSEQAHRPDLLPSSWSGYHDADCNFIRAASTYADPTADATCTFTERTNQNFGTVTSYLSGADKLPGIVFTPKKTGRYWVCAISKASVGTANAFGRIELSDTSSTIVGDAVFRSVDGNDWFQAPICGIYPVASISAKTLRLRTRATSGSIGIESNADGTSIEWSIFAMDQSFPAPVYVGSVTSQSTGGRRLEDARISTCTSSPCTVSSQSSPWLTSVTWSAVGRYRLNIAAGAFSAIPTCTLTPQYGPTDYGICSFNSSGTQSVTTRDIACGDAGDVDRDVAFEVICSGPR